ncbi:beta-ketoacyl synthase [Afipia carboxidovorans OM5]|uniref:Putative 3-oxoacyl-(Acyl-carrier-protein) synthase n=1 Tax=Afipia carboxidovorans (strain ATCC 49405 / DSM 1227 / KCTC 32145 / OM5) TaxID=504832 RepID=B6JHR9_AFIC5|nr:beta-ketoacyl-ACP synthase [Afipia carboxidovorans]ACI93612.1 beta-ketoacyl synthase [Afipia carboxidovorans OM5]AEI02697.1 putative 3-oxoacyl-(acyl-carrier-protein) synthase [Afipia carboxidovorans OM4]AEI06273.1 putative 3-oxoacyl-(acyl-carrier-protein) synthase [Afipia carboxidovorans OM5]
MNDKTTAREVWITGIGLASSLGEGLDEHWDALQARRINVDETTFAPYPVHPIVKLNYDAQIPKKGDLRQMESWQRIGTYAAGLALEGAGLKGNTDILSRMDMIVAAGGGERDLAVDATVLNDQAQGNAAPGALNERLMGGLRPTLFLAQLSNLLAGNISIVHGVTGSSRTFMGEEAAGTDAFRIALARIVSGQSDIALVGAAHNGERKDLLMLYEFGDFALKGKATPVWARNGEATGFALGSGGVFLVIESKEHAQARGAKPFARLSQVVADHARRTVPGNVTAVLDALWAKLGVPTDTPIITGATGAAYPTDEERAFLKKHANAPVRGHATSFGHLMEAQLPLGLALAALSIAKGKLFAANDSTGVEIESAASPSQIVVIGIGHWRGEGMALVERVPA